MNAQMPTFHTQAEIAIACNVSSNAIAYAVSRGLIPKPSISVGKRLLFTQDELEQALDYYTHPDRNALRKQRRAEMITAAFFADRPTKTDNAEPKKDQV